MWGQPPSAVRRAQPGFASPWDLTQTAHRFGVTRRLRAAIKTHPVAFRAVYRAPHSVRSTTTADIAPGPNPHKINTRAHGPLHAIFQCAAQQQEVTNHDPYQPVSRQASSHHPINP